MSAKFDVFALLGKLCADCFEKVKGDLVCSDCGAYLCEDCFEAHECEENEEC